jgi:hypothetical protein
MDLRRSAVLALQAVRAEVCTDTSTVALACFRVPQTLCGQWIDMRVFSSLHRRDRELRQLRVRRSLRFALYTLPIDQACSRCCCVDSARQALAARVTIELGPVKV